MSSVGHASEAVFSRPYVVDKRRYSRPVCSLQYLSIDAAKLARFIAAILDTIGSKSREDALKRPWRDIIAGASETDLLAFHFRSRMLDRK